MIVGLCKVQLRTPESQSLKEKRAVVKSLIVKLHRNFNISVSEVENQDSWQIITIGISCVSSSQRHVNQIFNNVISFIERERLDIELLDYEIELI